MKATEYNLIIKEIKETKESKGGIVIGNTRDVKFKKGEVLAIGDKVANVNKGDVVHYDGYRASDIDYKGERLQVLTYDLVVIVE